jgi:prepilin-type N-terminal cleavage/methylation domain-containing protein
MNHENKAFTLVELLLVIAIIGIMSALIITSVTNAAQDSRSVVARQQQVTLQDALNAWVARSSSGTNTIATARSLYSGAGTASAKLALLSPYLHPETYSHFTNYSTSSQVRSEAMVKSGSYLQFSTWGTNASNSYPSVQMLP